MAGADLTPSDGRWDGLSLDVARPAAPGLRVQVAAGRRLLMRQADRVVLLGRQLPRHEGVDYARAGRYRSPLPCLTAGRARRFGRMDGNPDGWMARWAYQFADWLRTSAQGPLHTGRWLLTPGMPYPVAVERWRRLPAMDRDRGRVDWYFGAQGPDVLALRRLSPARAGRVAAYRRQCREGILPPALLWWVSGLNVPVVVDGHDRIAAAVASDVVPPVLVLAPAEDPDLVSQQLQDATRRYQQSLDDVRRRAEQAIPVAGAHPGAVNRRFAGWLADIDHSYGRTRAWPLPGGRARWNRYAATLTPEWTNPNDDTSGDAAPITRRARPGHGASGEPA